MKIITPTHFALLSKDADGTLLYAGGGRVEMDKINYTATVEFFSDKSMMNNSAVFTYRIEGNRCHFNGMINAIKLDEIGQKVQ
jgi:hypothetical protein